MTDNEIIKALECCINGDGCVGCPLIDDEICTDNLRKYPLDLIKRQKAEIDILIRKKNKLQDEVAEKDAEIERLTRERDFYKAPSSELARGVEQIKTEAIKEFAERLKKKAFKPLGTWFNEKVVTENCIDSLVKEMTE